MAFQFETDESNALSEINIVPLVDVMLVLLIIFMVTAPLSIGGIHVDLPVSKARATGIDEKRIILSINEKGDFFIDKLQISSSSLPDKLKAIYAPQQKKEHYVDISLFEGAATFRVFSTAYDRVERQAKTMADRLRGSLYKFTPGELWTLYIAEDITHGLKEFDWDANRYNMQILGESEDAGTLIIK